VSRNAGVPAGGGGNARRAGGSRSAGNVATPEAPSVRVENGAVDSGTPKPGTRTRPRPSPLPKHSDRTNPGSATEGSDSSVLALDDVGAGGRIREFMLSPPALLAVAMTVLAVLLNHHRLALDLSGGRLLPKNTKKIN